MQSILASPFWFLLAVAVGFLVGWLLRESILLRRFNSRFAQAERDRDFARKEGEGLSERLSLSEADLKKAAFDAGQMTERLEKFGGRQNAKSSFFGTRRRSPRTIKTAAK